MTVLNHLKTKLVLNSEPHYIWVINKARLDCYLSSKNMFLACYTGKHAWNIISSGIQILLSNKNLSWHSKPEHSTLKEDLKKQSCFTPHQLNMLK